MTAAVEPDVPPSMDPGRSRRRVAIALITDRGPPEGPGGLLEATRARRGTRGPPPWRRA